MRIQAQDLYAGTYYRLYRDDNDHPYFYYQIYPWNIYPANNNPDEYRILPISDRYDSLQDAEEACKRKIEYLIDKCTKQRVRV